MKYEKGSFITVPNQGALQGISPIAQCLFMWLCFHANQDGECYPSRQRLAKLCGVEVKTIDRTMKTLTDMGLITKKKRLASKGHHLSNIYEIHIGGVAPISRHPSDFVTLGVAPKTVHELNESRTQSNEDSDFQKKSRSLEMLSDQLPNTAMGELPEIYHKPPLEVKEEKRLQRKISGLYDDSFGSRVITLVKHFCERYALKYGHSYGSVVKVDSVLKNISNYFKEGETEESLTEMLDVYFQSEKADKITVRLTTAFSDDTFRAWKQGKLGTEEKRREITFPFKIGKLLITDRIALSMYYEEGWIDQKGENIFVLSEKGRKEVENL